ncbi:MAG: hypothetical protein KAV87_26260 [Desulfobacteraceae bacterium]|nr:hypothetical protein [Desulfobacteraceae bacterium]
MYGRLRVMAIDVDKLVERFRQDSEPGYNFLKKITKIYFERYNLAKNQ